MKLKKLFVFRHGPYEGRGFLTQEGKTMIAELTRKLTQQYSLTPAVTTFICSKELRTLKTAQFMMGILGIDEMRDVCHQALFSDDRVCDAAAALEVVKKHANEFENLVVITHQEMASVLPVAFCAKVLSIPGKNIPGHPVSYGQGFFVDCEKKTCEFVR